MADTKEATIKQVYHNAVSGFGSLRDTYQQASKIDPSIRTVDVKEYLDSLKHRQKQFTPKGKNSFASPHPLFEIEVDLVDLSRSAKDNGGIRFGFVGIYNFTKYAHVVPIKSKTAGDVVKAMEEIFNKIGTPKQIYSDRETAFHSVEFTRS